MAAFAILLSRAVSKSHLTVARAASPPRNDCPGTLLLRRMKIAGSAMCVFRRHYTRAPLAKAYSSMYKHTLSQPNLKNTRTDSSHHRDHGI